MEVKSHIINESRRLLQRIGPSSMTMDLVARTCGISKRTLYEKFPDKRTLIKECLDAEHRDEDEYARRTFEQADNCFEALFSIYIRVREHMRSQSMAYVSDLRRLYPELFAKQREQEARFVDGLARALTQAQAEGLVLPDINTRIAAFLFLTTMRALHESDRQADLALDTVEVFDGAFLNFLRGIATGKGRTIIDAHAPQMRNTKKANN